MLDKLSKPNQENLPEATLQQAAERAIMLRTFWIQQEYISALDKSDYRTKLEQQLKEESEAYLSIPRPEPSSATLTQIGDRLQTAHRYREQFKFNHLESIRTTKWRREIAALNEFIIPAPVISATADIKTVPLGAKSS